VRACALAVSCSAFMPGLFPSKRKNQLGVIRACGARRPLAVWLRS
jgi:hypothetical protein